ncbi:hypothetical protein BMETH_1371111883, partial [methanotrophic bacterial endosymbiont of Bathymodiolus sp.]
NFVAIPTEQSAAVSALRKLHSRDWNLFNNLNFGETSKD